MAQQRLRYVDAAFTCVVVALATESTMAQARVPMPVRALAVGAILALTPALALVAVALSAPKE